MPDLTTTLTSEEVAHLKGVLLFHKNRTEDWVTAHPEEVPFINPQMLIRLDTDLINKLSK